MRADQADTRPKDLYIGSDVEIAKRVREDLTARHGRIVHAEGAFWRYSGTEWEAIEDHLIRLPVHAYDGAEFMTAAGEPSRVKLSKSRVDSVLNECAALCAEPHFFENPPAGINCASGFIRFDAAGTPHLEPHHRNHRCRHTLPGHWHAGMPGTAPEPKVRSQSVASETAVDAGRAADGSVAKRGALPQHPRRESQRGGGRSVSQDTADRQVRRQTYGTDRLHAAPVRLGGTIFH